MHLFPCGISASSCGNHKEKKKWDTLISGRKGNGYCSQALNIDLGHEAVFIDFDHPLDVTKYCKTNRKPYDLSVVSTLALLEMAGVIKNTSSDGDFDGFSDFWREAIQYSVEECLCYWKDDETCKKIGYKFPSVFEAQNAFLDVYNSLGEAMMVWKQDTAPNHNIPVSEIPEELVQNWF